MGAGCRVLVVEGSLNFELYPSHTCTRGKSAKRSSLELLKLLTHDIHGGMLSRMYFSLEGGDLGPYEL